MATDSMDVDMDLDFDLDADVLRMQEEAARLNAVRVPAEELEQSVN